MNELNATEQAAAEAAGEVALGANAAAQADDDLAAMHSAIEQRDELKAELAIVSEQRNAADATIAELRQAFDQIKAAEAEAATAFALLKDAAEQSNAGKLAAISQCNAAHERAEELAEALRLLQSQQGINALASQAISLPGDEILSLAQCPDDRAATLVIAADYLMSVLHMPANTRLRKASAHLDITTGARFAHLEICSPVLAAQEEGAELPMVKAEYLQAMPGTPPVVSFHPI